MRLLNWDEKNERFAGAPEPSAWKPIVLFIAPALIIYAGFIVFPVVKTVYNSVFVMKPPNAMEFVGLGNYRALLSHDDVFWKSMKNTAIFSVFGTIFDVTAGLILALCLFAKVPCARLWRTVWFSPVLISYVVVGIIWVWIYDNDWGAINTVLRWIGLGQLAHPWLGDPNTALWAVLATQTWKWAGFNMIVFLAALYALPADILGAAELDHCGWLAKVIYVILPMLRPTTVSLVVLSFVGKMMVFDIVWVMTRGGPLWSTETVSTYVYQRAFDWSTFDLGYPSAIAVLWFILILVFVALLTTLFREREKLEY